MAASPLFMSAAPRPYRTPSWITGSNGSVRQSLARAGGHDVGVAGEAEHRLVGAAPGPQVIDRAEFQPLDAEPERLEAGLDQVQAAVVVGADRGPAHQFFSQLQRRMTLICNVDL